MVTQNMKTQFWLIVCFSKSCLELNHVFLTEKFGAHLTLYKSKIKTLRLLEFDCILLKGENMFWLLPWEKSLYPWVNKNLVSRYSNLLIT